MPRYRFHDSMSNYVEHTRDEGALEDMQERLEYLETAVAIMVERGDTDGPAGTTCAEHPIDNDNEDEPLSIEVMKAQHVKGAMGDVYDELPDNADINKRNAEFWKTAQATPSASAGGNPADNPPPGNATTGATQNYMPGAARSISNARKLSTTQQVPDMMGRQGKMTADANRAYFSANDRMRATLQKMNAQGRQWNDTGSCPVSKPVAATRDQVRGMTPITTAAAINCRNRAHKWGV